MIVAVQQWISNLLKKKNLFILLPTNPLSIQIISDEIAVFVILTKNEIDIVESYEGQVDFYVRGDVQTVIDIVLGKIKLQHAMKNKVIEVKGSFRSVLLLESLFLLSRP